MIKKTCLILLITIISISIANAEIEIAPMVNMEVVGGQYVFHSTYPAAGSLGGNLTIDIIPAISFNNKLSLIPTVSYNYYGIKDVAELVDGLTLFQQRLDLFGGGKVLYELSDNLIIKGGGSYKAEYLIEAEGETWGNGLFDYTTWNGSGEIETILNDKGDSFSGGVTYYQTMFTNYEALIEKYGDEFQELQQTPGAKVLDYNASEILGDIGFKFSENFGASYNLLMTLKNFPEQYTIDDVGAYSSTELRADTSLIHNLGAQFKFSLSETSIILTSLNMNLSDYTSNQNHYDVGKFKAIANYYGYSGYEIAPSVAVFLGEEDLEDEEAFRGFIITILGSYGRRNYTERLAQDIDGEYEAAKIYTNTILAGLSVAYPVTRSIQISARANYYNKASNMKYEEYYKYNYYTINYYAGVSFEF